MCIQGIVCKPTTMMNQIHIDTEPSERGTEDTKGTVKLINLKQTDNAMA